VYPNEEGNDFASAASTMMIDPYIDDEDDDD